MNPDLWAFEKTLTAEGFSKIAGIDEAGRGPLAGPVVSAAVILPHGFDADGVIDSKKLTARRRRKMYEHIYAHATAVAIGIVDAPEIDRINILQATKLSMVMAVANLTPRSDYLIIDGNFTISSSLPQKPIVKGDSRSVSIAAASIVAKESRDVLMYRYHEDYPLFGFDRHKGYPTRAHKAAIAEHGPCLIHRRTFRGVSEHIAENATPFGAAAHG